MLSQQELDTLVSQLKEKKRTAEDIALEIKNIEQAIKSEMEERDVVELKGDDWKITWNMVTTNRFDQKSFKENHPDMYDDFTLLVESRRFLVK